MIGVFYLWGDKTLGKNFRSIFCETTPCDGVAIRLGVAKNRTLMNVALETQDSTFEGRLSYDSLAFVLIENIGNLILKVVIIEGGEGVTFKGIKNGKGEDVKIRIQQTTYSLGYSVDF